MPAKTFSTKGRRNGLSFCPPRKDVDSSDFDYMTLGGYRKGDSNVTDTQINDSLEGAMELFWNSYELDADASANITIGTDVLNAAVSDVVLQEGGQDLEPVDRVCKSSLPVSTDIQNDDDGGTGYASASVQIGAFPIVRMYEGGTFIGYGISGIAGKSSSSAGDQSTGEFYDAEVTLTSIIEDDPNPSSLDEISSRIDEVTISSSKLLSHSFAEVFDSGTGTPSTALLSASVSGGATLSASITGLNFWSYS